MPVVKGKKRMTVIVDPSRCVGCRSCELACAVAHAKAKGLMAVVRAGERPESRINVEAYGRKAVPVHCRHCEDPACVLVCPTGALHRDGPGEPVLIDEARCVGCKMCVQACPFGVLTVSADGKGVLKCDQCIARLAEGLEPACVDACTTKALVFGGMDEASQARRRKAAERLIQAAEAAEDAEDDEDR